MMTSWWTAGKQWRASRLTLLLLLMAVTSTQNMCKTARRWWPQRNLASRNFCAAGRSAASVWTTWRASPCTIGKSTPECPYWRLSSWMAGRVGGSASLTSSPLSSCAKSARLSGMGDSCCCWHSRNIIQKIHLSELGVRVGQFFRIWYYSVR